MPEYFEFQLATVSCGRFAGRNVCVEYKDNDGFCYCELSTHETIIIHISYLRFWVSYNGICYNSVAEHIEGLAKHVN